MTIDEGRYWDESLPPSVYAKGSTLTSIAPTTAVMAVATAYALVGTGFKSTSIVKANNVVVPSTFTDSTHINVAAYTGAAAGTVQFTVTTDGVVSNARPVIITATQEEPTPTDEEPCPPADDPIDTSDSYGQPVPIDELPPE